MHRHSIPALVARIVCGLFLVCPWLALGEIAVIVNRDNPVQDMTARQVSDFYLGRARSFASGEPTTIFEQPVDSFLRDRFFRNLNGMSLNQLNAYWARLRFSGEVLPPVNVADSRSMIARVRQDRSAIGYVDAAELDSSVRVVLLIKEIK